jgi:hypothetical protein
MTTAVVIVLLILVVGAAAFMLWRQRQRDGGRKAIISPSRIKGIEYNYIPTQARGFASCPDRCADISEV